MSGLAKTSRRKRNERDSEMSHASAQAYSRVTALFLILTIVAGWFGEMHVPSIVMTGDVATTADQLRLNTGLFRIGFAAYLLEAFSDVVLAWLFYLLLKPVNRELSLLSAFFGLVSMTLFAVTKMFYASAPMFISSTSLGAFPTSQTEALASLFLSMYARLNGLFMLFYGTAWIIRGWLTFKSGYLPRFLGVIMVIAGGGFVAKNIALVLAPRYSSDLLLAPMLLNGLALTIWLLAKGINRSKWDVAMTRGSDPLLT